MCVFVLKKNSLQSGADWRGSEGRVTRMKEKAPQAFTSVELHSRAVGEVSAAEQLLRAQTFEKGKLAYNGVHQNAVCISILFCFVYNYKN